MGISEEIKVNNIVLLMIPKASYHAEIINVLKAIDQNSTKVCHVCINEPYGSVSAKIKQSGMNLEKFYFIDTLTRNVQNPPQVDNCVFVSAPNALTEISLELSKALGEKKCNGTLFDTISALLIYENAHSIIKFIHNILTKLRISAGKAVFVALKEDVNSELVKDLYMFVDKVVDM